MTTARHRTPDGFCDGRAVNAMRTTVLHVITRMVRGGAQENTLATVLRVDPTRFRSILVTGPSEGPEGSLMECVEGAGVEVRVIPSLVREVTPAADLAAYGVLRRIMHDERPAIVHTHTSKAGILGRVAARRSNVPIVVHTPHGHVFHDYFGRLKTRAFITAERYCARYADRLVMLTENERREHLAAGIGGPEKFVTIHSGIDFSSLRVTMGRDAVRAAWGVGPHDRVIGTVGRLVPIKGQAHLIATMPAILARIPHAHLVLVGSGPLERDLRLAAQELGLQARVHFAGFRNDIANCLSAFDLFALPSLNEGMGRVIVEAMAMRLPVVASDVSGIRDLVVSGKNGLLVSASDRSALAEAILSVLCDPVLAACFGEAGYATAVPDYGLDNMITSIETLYDGLLKSLIRRSDGRRVES
jgi:glycosyltransferase involved in cell wall biosynthesis